MNDDFPSLAADCLSHLRREETLVQTMEAIVEEVSLSLRSRNRDRLGELIEQHSQVSVQLLQLSSDRQTLRNRIAAHFNVSTEVGTLALVVRRCDNDMAIAIDACRTRLTHAGNRLNGKLNANSNLAMQLSQLIENVFCSLMGDQARSPIYERSGRVA